TADCVLGAATVNLLPLQVLSRLVSGWWYLPLAPLVIALSVVCLSILAPLGVLTITLLCFMAPQQNFELPIASTPKTRALMHNVSQNENSPTNLVSPSLAIAKYYGLAALTKENLRFSVPALLNGDLHPTFKDYRNSDPAIFESLSD